MIARYIDMPESSQCIAIARHRLLINYCCPSAFKEVLPARKISSVERRLTAITELEWMI